MQWMDGGEAQSLVSTLVYMGGRADRVCSGCGAHPTRIQHVRQGLLGVEGAVRQDGALAAECLRRDSAASNVAGTMRLG